MPRTQRPTSNVFPSLFFRPGGNTAGNYALHGFIIYAFSLCRGRELSTPDESRMTNKSRTHATPAPPRPPARRRTAPRTARSHGAPAPRPRAAPPRRAPYPPALADGIRFRSSATTLKVTCVNQVSTSQILTDAHRSYHFARPLSLVPVRFDLDSICAQPPRPRKR